MKNIGFLVDSLGQSQLSYYLVENLNKWIGNQKDATIFFENVGLPISFPKFAQMNIVEMASFKGPLVATNISTARKLMFAATSPHLYFYVWDLEFLRGRQRDYMYHLEVFMNPRLKIICRNEDHKIAVENAFNIKVLGCVENFAMDQFQKLLANEAEMN